MSLDTAVPAPRKRFRLSRRVKVAAAAVVAFASLGAASPALAASQWSGYGTVMPNSSWTLGGANYSGTQYWVAKMGDSNHYATNVYFRMDRNGNTFFRGHVYNGTVGADDMKTSCTLRWPNNPQVGITLTTANYSIGGHSHKDWEWAGGRYTDIASQWDAINTYGYVQCSLRVV